METEIAEILSVLFNKKISPKDNISSKDEPDWDSFKHIEIIMVLEENLGIKFNRDEIPTLNSFKKIVKKIKQIKGL
ncbi:MAG: hypothetical protein BWY78_00090 [Alphaproteobacteria bacterium ADurb.Bin438]|nr:MAG: hypothetical protein BWY78_00090 [Alphaproteobacteria bacterium ADurb.Bin438]